MRRGTVGGMACVVVLMMALVSGCGEQTRPASNGGTAPLTARAVAAIALDHLAADTTTRRAAYVDDASPPGLVGADLRYGGDGETDGDLVEVTVSRGEGVGCARSDPGCARLDGGVVLVWETEVPEEDPGYVAVQRVVGGDVVTVLSSGPVITGDPRRLDLTPSVETLVELVADPRLRLATTEDVVAAGEEVTDWDEEP